MATEAGEDLCLDCSDKADGATCDLCGEPLCVACIVQKGFAVCVFCDDSEGDNNEDEKED